MNFALAVISGSLGARDDETGGGGEMKKGSLWCDYCENFMGLNRENHKCYFYTVIRIDDCFCDDDMDEIHEVSPKAAAEAIAEKTYKDDPCDPHEFEIKLKVVDPTGKYSFFNVSAEANVDFKARALE